MQYVDVFTRPDDNFNLPEGYRTKSKPTGDNIGFITTYLLKLENEKALMKLQEPIKELNELLAEIGFPECGYVVYKVNDEFKSIYTHILEGWWLNSDVYDQAKSHPKYKKLFDKYKRYFENLLEDQTYFRLNKYIPVL